MLKLSEALAGWSPGDASAAREPIVLLEAGWGEIVGPEVAKNSHPARIADGTLTVTTRSSAWSHQLSFLSEHVLRAVAARVPGAGVERLRFRVGRLAERSVATSLRRRGEGARPLAERAESADAPQALARFRGEVEERRRARRAQGWNECRGCGALVAPGAALLCPTCAVSRAQNVTGATARLLFEAPWLGRAGTIALVDGLKEQEYERIRTLVLAHWWRMLARARECNRLSHDGRERSVASSYVVLQSGLPPEEIMPVTVRSILGDELHDLLYGEAAREGGAAENKKRRT
jgi:Dna[CI] antecedent, DciA